MATTFELIATQTVSTAVSSLTFSSIPQTYKNLQFIISSRTTVTGAVFGWYTYYYNGSNSGVKALTLEGNGSATPTSGINTTYQYASSGVSNSATANTFSNDWIYIPNYTSSLNKTSLADGAAENSGTAYLDLTTNMQTSSTGITSVTFTPINTGAYSFMQYSTFSLYGIKNS